MVERIELLLKLLGYLEKENGRSCICDVLDRMYLSRYIRFEDIDKLHQYISEHIPDEVVDSTMLSENPEIFIYHLRKEIKALQGH